MIKKNHLRKVLTFAFIFSAIPLFSQENLSAKNLREKAFRQSSVQESISFLNESLEENLSKKDRRSVLYLKGTLEEQLGLYTEASKSYALAAGIAAEDADGFAPVTAEQLVLNAVRTALCAGEYDTADTYLNSAVRSSKNETVKAYVNLYSVWSSLCKAGEIKDTEESIALLNAYKGMPSMACVKPSVLLTLWYLTDKKEYSDALKKEFPLSPECAVVKGEAFIMSVPFWYFVPRMEHSNVEEYAEPSVKAGTSSSPLESKEQKEMALKVKRQQLGLFKSEENSKALIERLKAKGFSAYFYTEKRASGTTYYIVVVDENKEGTMGLKLKDAGFESYPVE